jgi:aspartate racemase
MKTIGLIGGMSWESSAVYYRILNREIARRLGGLHSARCVMLSVDFAEIAALQEAGAWDEAGRRLADDARRLEAAGADLLLLCANTIHRVADAVEAAISIPLLHLADATAASVRRAGVTTVGLLGTRYTMEQDFYRGRLEERHGLHVLTPGEDDRALVHRVIYEELTRGVLNDGSRTELRRMIAELADRGAEGVILGCTELPLLLLDEQASGEGESPVPLFDTTRIHAEAAVQAALAE